MPSQTLVNIEKYGITRGLTQITLSSAKYQKKIIIFDRLIAVLVKSNQNEFISSTSWHLAIFFQVFSFFLHRDSDPSTRILQPKKQ